METSARVLLLRHGAADGGGRCYGVRLDPELSADGIAQARGAGRRLDLADVDRIVCSPAGRARATLAHLGLGPSESDAGREVPTVVDARWSERDFGAWEGRDWTAIWDEAPPELATDPVAYAAFTPRGGETPEQVAARVAAALDQLADEPGTTLVVTHAGPIRTALAHALGTPLAVTFGLAVAPGRAVALGRVDGHWIVEGIGW